jgi:hypothetical protein
MISRATNVKPGMMRETRITNGKMTRSSQVIDAKAMGRAFASKNMQIHQTFGK